MSAEAVNEHRPGPQWVRGATSASIVFLICVIMEMMSLVSWISAANASGSSRVQGSLPLFPASEAIYSTSGGGFSIELQPGWLVVVVSLVAFMIASRPWSAFRSSSRSK
jgi:hypothetical protein